MKGDSSKDLDAAMRQYLDDELVEAALKQVGQVRPNSCQQDKKTQPLNGIMPQQIKPEVSSKHLEDDGVNSQATQRRFSQEIANIASTVLKIPPDRMDVKENMSRYGVDSIIVTEIMKRISDLLDLPIAPTVFFEARHLQELASILFKRYQKIIAQRYQELAIAEGSNDVSEGALGNESETQVDVSITEIDSEVKDWITKFRTIASSKPQSKTSQKTDRLEALSGDCKTAGNDYEPVAIIAMEGQFPESSNLQEFEQHLRQGDDCIREVPADRWDWRQVFGDPQQGEFSNVKYGGFTPDIDKFDPLFFGMSPKEAELMDPQHRLFIQCVWKLIESAGYAPKSLSGQKVGLFLGINLQDYAHLIDRSGAMEALHLTSLGHMFCPNRLSFLLDIHGPSQVIDTACSSSLVALHRAVLSIQHEDCEMAIAGGANLLISPDMHIMYSKVGMICEDGRCKSFSKQANGYVRSDGIGAVLVKSLSKAEQDGDTILAVIRGSAENHGGMSTSLTAPNPKAQASLIVEAHQWAKIDPRSIGYIECHGTGTSLGDPIEINGLKMAFEQLHLDAGVSGIAYCGLGSVKSNMGHAETAAGIAGAIKAVLAIRNKQLYPGLHCDEINPLIELEQSPFYILQQGQDWPRAVIEGKEQPRRAGVSSFGAGGSNAHIVIEEYIEQALNPVKTSSPALILLSARNEKQLAAVVNKLYQFLLDTKDSQTLDLADIAYTLQQGRDAMAERLALTAETIEELKEKLSRICQGQAVESGYYKGNIKQHKKTVQILNEEGALEGNIKKWFAEGNIVKLAEHWIKGVDIDWHKLYAETHFESRHPHRISLPTYPFEQKRYWLPETGIRKHNRSHSLHSQQLHPLLQKNTSDLSEQRFSSTFTGKEFFLADHVVMGDKVLPGVAYLEMARAAIKQVSPEIDTLSNQLRFRNVVWAKPYVMVDQPVSLHISLNPEQKDQVSYQIYSTPKGQAGERVLHSQGLIVSQLVGLESSVEILDLVVLRDKVTSENPEQYQLNSKQCYAAFRAMSIEYGASHQGIELVYFSPPVNNDSEEHIQPQVLAKLILPRSVTDSQDQFVLHPSMMDSGLQACIGLIAASGAELPTDISNTSETAASLPFALDEFNFLQPLVTTMWVWIRYAEGSTPHSKVQKLNIDFCDEQGRVCIQMKGFSSRRVDQTKLDKTADVVMCKPEWKSDYVTRDAVSPNYSTHQVLLCAPDGFFPKGIEHKITDKTKNISCLRLPIGEAIQDSYRDAAIQLFEIIKALFNKKDTAPVLVQILIESKGKGQLLSGLSGLLKTAAQENSKFYGQIIEIDDGVGDETGLVDKVISNSKNPKQNQIRYTENIRQVMYWEEVNVAQTTTNMPWKDNGIYLLTGGSGGLGFIFAKQIAEHTNNATVILCARSELSTEKKAQLDQLSSSGINVEYSQSDISQQQEVDALIASLIEKHGRIDGLLHCAGLLRDNFIQKKSAEEFAEVLAPKVDGSIYLDRATKNIDLDFFVLFSSAAGAWGSAGQADYATANAFLDAFVLYRNALVASKQRYGHTVSINWPLWADGGMRMEAAAETMMQQSTGLVALQTDNGIQAFNQIMAMAESRMMVMQGSRTGIRRLLTTSEKTVQSSRPDSNGDWVNEVQVDTTELQGRISQMLLQAIAELMKFELEDLDVETELSEYGFDSITLTDFANKLNQQFQLELTPTIFFEHSTIVDFAAYLSAEYQTLFAAALGVQTQNNVRTDDDQQFEAAVPYDQPRTRFTDRSTTDAQKTETDDTAVAIIGMSGCFPKSKNLDEFWSNLQAGTDCISEIPEDRWDWQALYGDPATEANKTNIKWGGFIDGVGGFDAQFFGISPREAELMDPQQRLLMQYAWKAIEDAGYSGGSLSGSNTAIFIGTASSGYGELMAKNGSAIEGYSSTGVVGSVGPNRMSYFLNLHGPSEPIETACSSSLVAIHRALAAMANGDCDQAIVGGINLIISPETQISFNKAGMLCQDGRCKTFSSQANGYVRGEGVGMLLLKKLKAAEQANDHIYGVIRASAENHGGRGNSLTAPNPKAQAELLKTAYTRAGIDPRTVSYIEAHGTGTELGDPIEINGLKSAFSEMYQAIDGAETTVGHCGLGSVKTNIGHLELAAGIAGVIKVLLQLKHKTLVKSLHCDELNPYIKLQHSPFYIVQDNKEWTALRDAQGRELPRRAGVSSFGFGGVNAHVVIEEYQPTVTESGRNDEPETPYLLLLSAKNSDRLLAYASSLLAFIKVDATDFQINAPQVSDQAYYILLSRIRGYIAEILHINTAEIELTQNLQDYGFDPIHRTMLVDMLQQTLGIEIDLNGLLDKPSIDLITSSLLEKHPVLRSSLNQQNDVSALDLAQLKVDKSENNKQHTFSLADLAYTLQVGRDPMEERFAVMVSSIAELEDKLCAFIEGRTDEISDLYLGQVKQNRKVMATFTADEELQEALDKWIQRRKFSKLLDMWVKGLNFDWEKLYGESKPYRNRPSRISAPSYPFAEQRFWIEPDTGSGQSQTVRHTRLHPLVHENVSTFQDYQFKTTLTGSEFFLADHRVQGQKVLPGVAYLEMARAAVMLVSADMRQSQNQNQSVFCLQDVVWIKPVMVTDQAQEIYTVLSPEVGAESLIRYEIVSLLTAKDGAVDAGKQIYSQGVASISPYVSPPKLDLAEIQAQLASNSFQPEQCYQLFSALGIDYGTRQQGIDALYAGDGQVLAKLELPESLLQTQSQFVLHPCLMDSALQASIGLAMSVDDKQSTSTNLKLSLPFAVDRVEVFSSCVDSMWVWVRYSADNEFSKRIQKLDIDLCDEQGDVCVQFKGFTSRLIDSANEHSFAEKGSSKIADVDKKQPLTVMGSDELRAHVVEFFKQLLADTLKYPIGQIRLDDALEIYGVDSMMIMELTTSLEKSFGSLSKTLFFEYQTLDELVEYFLQTQQQKLLQLFGVNNTEYSHKQTAVKDAGINAAIPPINAAFKPKTTQNYSEATLGQSPAGALDVAIIGLSGRYPQSRNIEEFWQNLRDGNNCITEVPKERWDWREYYSEDRSQQGWHFSKWGGFIADVDKFDPLFFNILPREAEYMDPQERLFLEHAWMALEDAGYRREDLQKPFAGSINGDDLPAQVGVYAGVMYGEYQLLGLEASLRGKPTVTASVYASIANRVSYLLNLHGPSMTVDTMCSSSLTAIHLACQDLRLGRTDLGLAGGVNISIHPNKYKILSSGQYISSRGQCESFGEGGDGYIPGEGVGAVILKRLADAERDGDHIYGVIKGSALNHDGKTNGFSVPNPNAQQAVISRVLREARIDPRAVSYIEAHGTGTKLGDPIEITGLSKAFGIKSTQDQHCWLGSAKSNIGHCESAAGIAGLTKVLLQMREGQIAPSLHSQTLNPNIDFSSTPFEVNQQLRDWSRPVIDGQTEHRIAGISSFGAGGSNAHMIVEEYIKPAVNKGLENQFSHGMMAYVIVLSARTEHQLQESVENMLKFSRLHQTLSIADMAYTLQVGREVMSYRLAFLAESVQQVIEKLELFLQDETSTLHFGRVTRDTQLLADNEYDPQSIAELISNRSYGKLLGYWVKGARIDWGKIYAGDVKKPSRMSLPTYPFARERYWLDLPDNPPSLNEQKEIPAATQTDSSAELIIYPVWKAQAVQALHEEVNYIERRLLSIGSVIEIPNTDCIQLLSTSDEVDRRFKDYAVQIFTQIQTIFKAKPKGQVLLQIVICPTEQPLEFPEQLLHALAAMLKTAHIENPQFIGQLIELEVLGDLVKTSELTDKLYKNAQSPDDRHIRYIQGIRSVMSWAELEANQQKAMPIWKQGGVYLITGGVGGLGLIFAREIVRQVNDVTLILTGRSQLNDTGLASIAELQRADARVEYRRVDVTDKQAVRKLIQSIDSDYRNSQGNGLNGIIHSAGIFRDNFIFKKTAMEMEEVLAAKVSGVVNLDLASRFVNLDFFILFSSVAGALGNSGQSDYATANAFMDSYAAYRNQLLAGQMVEQTGSVEPPKGHTLSINWPLWQQGGMDIDPQSQEMMWRTVGLKPMQTQTGINALYRGLAAGKDQIMVLEGDVSRLQQLFLDRQPEQNNEAVLPSNNSNTAISIVGQSDLIGNVETFLKNLLSDMLKLPIHRIEVDEPIEQYGIDSVAIMTLTNELEKTFGSLPKTLFFEYPSIKAVTGYFVDTFQQQLVSLLKLDKVIDEKKSHNNDTASHQEKQNINHPAGDTGTTKKPEISAQTGVYDIAIIGMSGRFPLADNVDEYWQNLVQGRDCIIEIPKQRWDYEQYFDQDKNKAGKSYCKWGGFLSDVDKFDPLFFKISPKEAELLDPQERLFLETVWNLLETSGYLGETLQNLCQSQVGVFVGSMSQQYHSFETDLVRESLVALSSHSSIANRVSYFFNFQGPSIAIDTMCSSALGAIHMACESLLKGECKTAIAGGINLTIHPKKYLGLSSAQIVGSHPDSTSFGDGDGYIPAETVGAVLLKPLAAAIADNDTILAVIKSTAINHGGQSNGYSVPNSSAQTDLIVGNFARAEIDPRTISYVESAANGSPLGDAIELKALTAGFQQYTAEQQFCAIGSAKANIGHAEAASGMSQLIKVVLQLQHQQLVPTIKAEPLNPEISFEQTPFYLQRQLEPWYRPIIDGQGECLRLATVSSFGAGGSNAHLIVEEYEPVSQQEPVIDKTNSSQLMLFSARTAEQLHVVVRNMLAFIEQQPELPLDNLAYTLQTGREVMAYRMALVVDDQDQLIHGLQAYLENNSGSSENIFSGDQEQDNSDIKNLLLGETGQSILQLLLAEKDLSKLAVYWVKGVKIVWQPMYQNQTLHRIALPSYPFDKKSYWLGGKPLSADAPLLIAAEQEAMAIDPDPLRPILDNIQHYLITRLSQELGIPVSEISMSKNLQDYGADSMFAMKLRHGLDEVFQLKISTKDLLLHDTLISLAEYCLTKAPKQLKKNNSKLSADDKTLESQVTTQPLTSPLSEGQKGLWLLHQFNPQMSAYNVPIALRFKAGLNRSVFQRACKYILQYYPLLGATFQQNNGELYQTLIPETHLCFEHENIDLTDEADIVELLREKSKQAFDLAHGSLFRVHLFSPTQADETYVLITVHHIVFDGSSAVLLIKALMQAYQQLVAGTILALKPVQTSYFDFVQWQQQFLAGEQGLAQLNYWKSQLSGDLPVLSLPCDHKRPAVQRFKGASYELMLTPELSGKVKALAKSLRVNLSVLFLGVLNMLLHRYSGDEDILIGMPILGRPESRFEQIIGYFINMIVIRCQISGQQGFSDLLNSLQMTVADGVDNSDYPFPTLLKELNVSRDQARSPLFQVTYAYQNFLQPNDLLSDEMAIPVEFLSGINQEGSHDFTLEVYQGAEQFLLKIDYNTDLFKAGTIARIMTHYSNLLSSVIAQPDVNIADHELLSAQEKQQFLSKWNICEIDYDKEQSIVELFQQQVQQNPGSTALLFEGQQLSYKELDQHSSKLANYLLNSGVTENDLVGVCMDRSLHMVVAMLAIFKAGAVYVPIVPSDPEQRIQYLLDNSKIKVLITEEKLQEKFADLLSASACSSFAIDTQWQAILASETDLIPTVKLSQAAYVIYTSGSTGQPKGVVISHGALSHHCQVMGDYYQLTPADKVLQFASINVDASLEQLLPALLVGATVVIRPNELWSSQAFRSKVMELDISVVDVPPSYLYELLLDTRSEAEWAAVASLKLIITGGEVLSVETVKLWRISPLRDCRLLNAYGPTETTITSTVFEVDAENPAAATASTIPIGRPLVNESVYILDAYDQPVPVGVSGEMHIGGAGLAIGYLNQPELTEQKFIDDPFKQGKRLYKTGDLVRWLEDGSIEFMGRMDHQVKIRGFRVECGEIETALLALDSIKHAVVLAKQINGSTQLIAFAVQNEAENTLNTRALKQALIVSLPDYMIPSVFVSVEHIPLTASRKVDSKALMQLDVDADENHRYIAPRTEIESQLAEIWQQVLNVERIGVHDNFFDLGGHSLLSVRLMAVIQKRFDKELPISSLFQASDIAAQAQLLQQNVKPWTPLVCLQPKGKEPPFFCIHAVGGSILCYQELSQSMGEQRPFYGLQAPNSDAEEYPETIEELAALYIIEIRSVQAQGPYQLGGWSMGGVIAYEIARQLEQEGEQVSTLVLIESHTPGAVQAFEQDYIKTHMQHSDGDSETLLLMAFARDLGLGDVEKIVSRSASQYTLTQQLDVIFKQAKQGGLLLADIDSEQLHRLFSVFAANVQAMNNYTPQQYQGSIKLFYVNNANRGVSAPDYAKAEGWSELVQGELHTEKVSGDHYSLLRQPNVQILADKLTGYMDEKNN